MKKQIRMLYLVIIVMIFQTFIFAQSEVVEKSKLDSNVQFGIGVLFTNLWQDWLYDGHIPTIFVPININNKIKIEPELSFYKTKDDDDYDKRVQTIMRMGVGIFGIINYEKAHMYYGMRAGYLVSTIKLKYKDPGYYDEDKETTSKRILFGPAVGGEYFFISHFSVGGEVGFRMTAYTENEDGAGFPFQDNDIAGTIANIFLRFYF